MIVGGIEAGGTKFVCTVGTGPDDLREVERFPTTTPDETIARAIAFFRRQPDPLSAIGIGTFGPADVDRASLTFGQITTTPKPGWQGADVVGPIADALGVPVAFDTDVNAAALGEHRWGAAQDVDTFVYLTVGTGIGGGALVAGRRIQGLTHPEMGHMLIPRQPGDDFAGICPYHGDCWEGMACGPAIEARWGRPGVELAADHPAWALEARYLALGIANLVLTLSPQRVIVGGGVMQQSHLHARVRDDVREVLNGYAPLPDALDAFIVPPGLGDRAGVLGAVALARETCGLEASTAHQPAPADGAS